MSLFKNIIAFRIGSAWAPPALPALETELERLAFQPCGPTQQISAGWQPPRGEENGALVESIGGQVILKLAVERKSVPASAVKAALAERVAAIEAERGRKPGKKEKAELKEEIILDMLPRAFAKRAAHFAWLDVANRFLVVGAGSQKAADAFVTNLVDVMATLGHVLQIAPIQTGMAPATAMAQWLAVKEAPADFSVDRDLVLKNEDKAVVRYQRHDLAIDEVVNHIEAGMVPVQVAMTYDGRVSFVLTDSLVVKKIDVLEVNTDVGENDSGFDGDVALMTGELSKLLPALLGALGGEKADPADDAEKA